MLCTESRSCWILSCWRAGHKSVLKSTEGRKGKKGIRDKPYQEQPLCKQPNPPVCLPSFPSTTPVTGNQSPRKSTSSREGITAASPAMDVRKGKPRLLQKSNTALQDQRKAERFYNPQRFKRQVHSQIPSLSSAPTGRKQVFAIRSGTESSPRPALGTTEHKWK